MSSFDKEIFCASPCPLPANARKDRRDFRSQRGFIMVSTPIIRFSQQASCLVATLRKQTKTKHHDINNLSRRRYRGVTQRGDIDGARCIKYEIQYKLSNDINLEYHLATITSRLHSLAQ